MKVRVLVADDDEESRGSLKDALSPLGFEVVEAHDGAEALQAIARALDGDAPRLDAVVLDVRMPALSGLGVLSVLRGHAPRVPTFVITGLVDPSIEALVMRLGGARVFRKPVDVDDLVGALLDVAGVRSDCRHLSED
ncbi:MAG: response regulator [Myxococcota bacterium]|nr:response regulator [Myxococcota bacterium]